MRKTQAAMKQEERGQENQYKQNLSRNIIKPQRSSHYFSLRKAGRAELEMCTEGG